MLFDEVFLKDFNDRHFEFRTIESEVTKGKHTKNPSLKSYALLSNMELCYAAKAYLACLVIACAAIEASLSHEFGKENSFDQKIKKSGYKKEIDWLRKLRNNIVHDNKIDIYELEIDEQDLMEKCKKAFMLVHTIYYKPIKA